MRIILYIIAFAVALCACNNSTQKNRILDAAESIAVKHPDSAQMILETLYPYSKLTLQQKARCGILLATTKLQQSKAFASDSLLDNSISYFKQNSDSIELFGAYQLKAYQSMWRNQQDSMFYYLKQSINMAGKENKNQLYSLNMKLADIYSEPYADKDYNKAIGYTKAALTYAETDQQKAYALHQIGALYSLIKENDSALVYIARAIDFSQQNKGESTYIQYVLNYANTPDVNYEKAKRYLSELPENSLGRLITLGFLNLNNKHIGIAEYFCDKADSLFNSAPDKYSINTYNSLRILNACVKYALDEKVSVGEGVTRNDSISQVISRKEALTSEISNNNLLLQKYIHESQLRTQRKIVIILSIVFFGIILFFLYDRNNKKQYIKLRKELDQIRVNQIELQFTDSENDKKTELTKIWKKKTDICRDNFIRNGWMKKLQTLEGNDKHSNDSFLSPTEREKLRKLLFEEFTDVIIDIKTAGNGVNLDDLSLCLLCLLKVNNTTISKCMGASENAIRTRKSRLKEKLDPLMYRFIFCR